MPAPQTQASSKNLSEFADTGRPDPRDVTFCTFASFGGQHYEMAEFVLRPDYAPVTPLENSPGGILGVCKSRHNLKTLRGCCDVCQEEGWRIFVLRGGPSI